LSVTPPNNTVVKNNFCIILKSITDITYLSISFIYT
jgi:hypothetical protein